MIEAIFLRELKNRFRCEVLLGSEVIVCYVPSSCKLGNFADFSGCKVLICETKGNNVKLRYMLYAIRYHRRYLLVDLKETNRVIGCSLKGRRFSFLGSRKIIKREVWLEKYKCDFYIPKTKSVIEVKSIIALSNEQILPVVHSERALLQLKVIINLLQYGYKVYYFFVSLYSGSEKIVFNNSESEYDKLLDKAIRNGLICKVFRIKIKNEVAYIDKEIPFESR